MKNQQWLSKIKAALSVSPNRKSRNGSRQCSRLDFQKLENRNLLASVGFDSSTPLTFTADGGQADSVTVSEPTSGVLQIQVGNGDSIELFGDALSDSSFQLSQSVVPNDTLQISSQQSSLEVRFGQSRRQFPNFKLCLLL